MSMQLKYSFVIATGMALASPVFAHDNLPAIPQAAPVVIDGATVHTAVGEPIRHGRVRFEAGRIVAVGGAEVSTDGAVVVDAHGQHLYPGLFAAEGTLGMSEIAAVRATNDVNEVGANNADVRAEVAFNPDSELIPVTRANGVLLAMSVPGSASGNVIAGQSAIMKLDGWTAGDMQIKAPACLHVSWPGGVIPEWLPPPAQEAARKAQEEGRGQLRRAFKDAERYAAAKGQPGLQADRRLEAMIPAVSGDMPVCFHADDAQSIQDSLDFAMEHHLRPVIMGGLDAWQLTDALKAADAAVVFSGTQRLPAQRGDAVDTVYTAPAKLQAAGVRWALSNGGGEFGTSNLRNLPYQAGAAVGYGLSSGDALRAITLYPARIFGIEGDYGSIDPGLSATMFLADGDVLEPSTSVRRAWIDGRELDLSSRHTRLNAKYRQKYPETRN